jgi:hypothetical protein
MAPATGRLQPPAARRGKKAGSARPEIAAAPCSGRRESKDCETRTRGVEYAKKELKKDGKKNLKYLKLR